jgi:hypothetical protein
MHACMHVCAERRVDAAHATSLKEQLYNMKLAGEAASSPQQETYYLHLNRIAPDAS